jgi:uncharacterized protein YbjT (DUF2867 family)
MKDPLGHEQKRPIVITGASGRVGNLVAEALLEQGLKIRAVARNVSKLAELKKKGAEAFEADFTQTEKLISAFTGAESVFLLSPTNLKAENLNEEQIHNVQSIIKAVRESGVKNVVLLSSWGTDLVEKSGGILGCRFFEQELDKIADINTIILRPVWFMENFSFNISLMKMAGLNGLAIHPEVRFPMIATPDIAKVAAEFLRQGNFVEKKILYLRGPREFNMKEVTRILGDTIHMPGMKYVEFPQSILKKGMASSGLMSEDGADMLIEINQAISNGMLKIDSNFETRITETSLQHFAATSFTSSFHQAPRPSLAQKVQGAVLKSILYFAGKRLLKKEQQSAQQLGNTLYKI